MLLVKTNILGTIINTQHMIQSKIYLNSSYMYVPVKQISCFKNFWNEQKNNGKNLMPEKFNTCVIYFK